jgi:hypothetical protein
VGALDFQQMLLVFGGMTLPLLLEFQKRLLLNAETFRRIGKVMILRVTVPLTVFAGFRQAFAKGVKLPDQSVDSVRQGVREMLVEKGEQILPEFYVI